MKYVGITIPDDVKEEMVEYAKSRGARNIPGLLYLALNEYIRRRPPTNPLAALQSWQQGKYE